MLHIFKLFFFLVRTHSFKHRDQRGTISSSNLKMSLEQVLKNAKALAISAQEYSLQLASLQLAMDSKEQQDIKPHTNAFELNRAGAEGAEAKATASAKWHWKIEVKELDIYDRVLNPDGEKIEEIKKMEEKGFAYKPPKTRTLQCNGPETGFFKFFKQFPSFQVFPWISAIPLLKKIADQGGDEDFVAYIPNAEGMMSKFVEMIDKSMFGISRHWTFEVSHKGELIGWVRVGVHA